MITLKSAKSKYFMSGEINLLPGQSLTVDENILTERQLRDILYNVEINELIVDNLGLVQSRLAQLSTPQGGSSTESPITLKRITELEKKVETFSTDMYWSTTDW